ncbi:MAG: hypothetical protein ACTSYD_04090 [Candidatus Heimdallarchaeaceae archaeon]
MARGRHKKRDRKSIVLKLDIDNECDMADMIRNGIVLSLLDGKMFNVKNIDMKTSPSGKGLHVEIEIEPLAKLDEKDIIILQLLLGSDRTREFFNWIRVRGGLKKWNILFEQKTSH